MPMRAEKITRDDDRLKQDKSSSKSRGQKASNKMGGDIPKNAVKHRNWDVMLTHLCTIDKALDQTRIKEMRDKATRHKRSGNEDNTQEKKKSNDRKSKSQKHRDHPDRKEEISAQVANSRCLHLPHGVVHSKERSLKTCRLKTNARVSKHPDFVKIIRNGFHHHPGPEDLFLSTDSVNHVTEKSDVPMATNSVGLQGHHKLSNEKRILENKHLRNSEGGSCEKNSRYKSEGSKPEKNRKKMKRSKDRRKAENDKEESAKVKSSKQRSKTSIYDSEYEEEILRSKVSIMSFGDPDVSNGIQQERKDDDCETRDTLSENNSLKNEHANEDGFTESMKSNPSKHISDKGQFTLLNGVPQFSQTTADNVHATTLDANDISEVSRHPSKNKDRTSSQSKDSKPRISTSSESSNSNSSHSKESELVLTAVDEQVNSMKHSENDDSAVTSRTADKPLSPCRVITIDLAREQHLAPGHKSKNAQLSIGGVTNHKNQGRAAHAGKSSLTNDGREMKEENHQRRHVKSRTRTRDGKQADDRDLVKTNRQEMKHLTRSSPPHRSAFEKDLEREKVDRKSEGYYCSVGSHKEIKLKKQRRQNKKNLSSEDERSQSPSKYKSSHHSNRRPLNKTNDLSKTDAMRPTSARSREVNRRHITDMIPESGEVWPESRRTVKTVVDFNEHPYRATKSSKHHSEKNKNKVIDDVRSGSHYGDSKQHERKVPISESKTVKKVEEQSDVRRRNRMVETSNWHTMAYGVTTTVRADRRSRDYPRNGCHEPRSRHPNRKSVSTDSSSSTFSSSSTSIHSSQSSCQSSSKRSSSGGRHDIQYSGQGRAHDLTPTSSCESSSWNDSKGFSSKSRNVGAKPIQQRSASTSSTFQTRAIDRKKQKNPKMSGELATIKRHDKKQRGEEDYSSNSPQEEIFEAKFRNRHSKRSNGSALAEEDSGHSLWQHHRLVLVSQKPQKLSKDKPTSQKATQLKQISKRASNSDKRNLTIRDLYSLHNVLSDTQNGTVISGYRRNDGLRVAIKRISKAGTNRWGWLGGKVVPLELSLLCQVNEARCRGVVEIVEWHETTEAFLLIMVRPHPAVDLYDYVSKHKRIKETLARHIVRQLVTSLQHCIKSGVLHRDVKLENVLLNPETMDITLIDLGCGDYVRSGPYNEFAGTPEYYAPEWFLHKQYHGEQMTVWSIGVLLYSLLCGALPFRSSKEISEKEATKFPSDISKGARDLVANLLQKNPKERIGLNSILSHFWFAKSERTKNNST
ncbi:uncharacterized protein LOC143452846 [Clavelina lepadiformis]|uniref:uncharacterized protein LOC143452846 n=1 Tax=Clavelina lepadiformis TaxID=159417 RepID=UPI0040416798